MSDYQVEKNIPYPLRPSYGKYPFDEMEAGDSFFILTGGVKPPAAYSAASCYGRRHDMKFSCRKVEDGYRIWRIK